MIETILILIILALIIVLRTNAKDKKEWGKYYDELLEKKEVEIKSALQSQILIVQHHEKFVQETITQRVNEWREAELKNAEENIKHSYELKFQDHIIFWEKEIRGEAIRQSRAVLGGQHIENILPFLPSFIFNPGEARFIGDPIDFIVFEKSTLKNEEVTIHFLEVKTGKSRISEKQKRIKEAVLAGRVKWETVIIDKNEKTIFIEKKD